MSGLTKLLASVALIISLFAFLPGSAEAQWHGGWRGGWHGGWRGGGWGWGRGFGWGWGYPYAYYPGPYYYPGPPCGWTHVRVWWHGHWAARRVWRCW